MRLFVLGLAVVLFVAACAAPVDPLPTPNLKCAAPVSWRGLMPGQSTREDVTRVLGRPAEAGSRQYSSGSVPFLSYPIEAGGVVAQYSRDRVFFRADGVVAWIEVTRADRDGKFHPAAEIVRQLGRTLDIVYTNSNYDPANRWQHDVLAGPDQLYVWSECGMALDVHGTCSAAASGALVCLSGQALTVPRTPIPSDLVFRHPNPIRSDEPIQATSDNAILMEFLFPPTTYQGFTDHYMDKIPYGQWRDYLREIERK